MVEGLPAIKATTRVCKGCIVGKHPEHKFDRGKASHEKSISGMIHSDVKGPIPTKYNIFSWYVLTFIDDFSIYTWVFFLKKQYDVLERFIEFKASIENSSGRKIKYLIYDKVG